MTTVTWIMFFSTPHWVFHMMVVAAIIATVCILYAITADVEQSWSQRPSQTGNPSSRCFSSEPGLEMVTPSSHNERFLVLWNARAVALSLDQC